MLMWNSHGAERMTLGFGDRSGLGKYMRESRAQREDSQPRDFMRSLGS